MNERIHSKDETTKSTVLVVSFHLFPDASVGARRPSELIEYLTKNGHLVEAVTATTGSIPSVDIALEQRLCGIKTMRVPQPPSLVDICWHRFKRIARKIVRSRGEAGSNLSENESRKLGLDSNTGGLSLWKMLRRNYHAFCSLFGGKKIWALQAIIRLLIRRFSIKYEVVFATGPPFAAHIVGLVAAKVHVAMLIVDFRDPWTGNFFENSSSVFRTKLEHVAERRCLSHAEAVLVTSPGLAEALKARYPDLAAKIVVIFNGFDGTPTARPARPPGRLDILFAGSLYLNRDPFPFLEALRNLTSLSCVDRNLIRMHFVGNCSSWNEMSLRTWIDTNGMSDIVTVSEPVSANEISKFTRKSTLLVNFAQGQLQQIPAKTFDYLASGKEVLLISEKDSATAQLLLEIGAGTVVDPIGGSKAICAVLMGFYETLVNGTEYTASEPVRIREFSREKQFDRIPIIGMQEFDTRSRAEIEGH